MDAVFKALADTSRRSLLDSLNARNGQTLTELCAGLEMTRQSVSKHLTLLEEARLITTTWRGREKVHHLNAEPINAIADRWISRYHRQRVQALADLKTALEETTMSNAEFVYTTYIRTTPEALWRALTDPAFTIRYWGMTFDTDWQAGSSMVWLQGGTKIVDSAQQVLESVPYRRLSYSWHTLTPEWAEQVGISADYVAKASAQPRSTVTFDLEPEGAMVKLTVIHDGIDPDSVVLASVRQGWPAIVSSLKSLLETGEPLPPAE
jgi:uncharacterized protein YndB with AHSA1/START domain/DNA-binding transcriptional ArsR family regulator